MYTLLSITISFSLNGVLRENKIFLQVLLFNRFQNTAFR